MASTASGLRGKDFTVAAGKATADQIRNLETALHEADKREVTKLVYLAMLCAGIGESSFRIVKNPTSVYSGVFQADPKNIPANNTAEQARCFLEGGKGFQGGGAIAIAKAHPEYSAGHIAFLVEGDLSNFGGDQTRAAAFYDKWHDEAENILSLYHKGAGAPGGSETVDIGGTPDRASVVPYEFTYSPTKAVHERARFLADEVVWRLWPIRGVMNYASDDQLFAQAPVAELAETDEGVESIRWTVSSTSRRVQEVTVRLRSYDATIVPGACILIADEGEQCDGRWLVSKVERDLFDTTATLSLALPVTAKPEPRSHVVYSEGTPSTGTTTGGDADDASDTAQPVDHLGDLSGLTPANVINRYVLPIGRHAGAHAPNGTPLTVANNTAANATHSHLGSASDHAGPPDVKWAADLSIGPDIRGGGNAAGAAKGDRMAKQLAALFGIPWNGSGLASSPVTHGFRFQLIWRYEDAQAGNHYTHVHFGVARR